MALTTLVIFPTFTSSLSLTVFISSVEKPLVVTANPMSPEVASDVILAVVKSSPVKCDAINLMVAACASSLEDTLFATVPFSSKPVHVVRFVIVPSMAFICS
jgi:hypothetical protein